MVTLVNDDQGAGNRVLYDPFIGPEKTLHSGYTFGVATERCASEHCF